MALGDLTKQLAEQAIRSAASKPAAPPPAESLGAAVLGQVQAMQKALKDDEELLVLYHAGGETLRVLEFFLPSGQLIVLSGADKDRNVTRVIAPAESLQLVCKVIKVPPPAKPARINFIAPRAKPESGS
jgi:hypothetical protein